MLISQTTLHLHRQDANVQDNTNRANDNKA